jgi:hypothetical protein
MTPDSGRWGITWVLGALEPATGDVFTCTTLSRRTADFAAFLDGVVTHWSQGEIVIILDIQLWTLANPRVRFLFQPTYAPWLNMIEPRWKTLRSFALTGSRFETPQDIAQAVDQAPRYWLDHRHPYTWHKAA